MSGQFVAKWLETLPNDGQFEYTVSAECDGSNPRYWRRTPEQVAVIPVGAFEEISPEEYYDVNKRWQA